MRLKKKAILISLIHETEDELFFTYYFNFLSKLTMLHIEQKKKLYFCSLLKCFTIFIKKDRSLNKI